jgi:uncharacterized membrane protein YqaE (UPF0057 family)
MKYFLTLVILLVATCILLTSCSQTSNLSHKEINYPGSSYVGLNDKIQTTTTKGETYYSVEKNSNSIQTETEGQKDSMVENNIIASTQQPILITRINSNKGIQNNSVGIGYHSDDKGLNRKSNMSISESKDKQIIEQSVTYSNNTVNSGRPSGGIPFWLIFLFAFFIPPVGVALMFGITDKFWICLLLTLFFWLPGMIYAMIQIFG